MKVIERFPNEIAFEHEGFEMTFEYDEGYWRAIMWLLEDGEEITAEYFSNLSKASFIIAKLLSHCTLICVELLGDRSGEYFSIDMKDDQMQFIITALKEE